MKKSNFGKSGKGDKPPRKPGKPEEPREPKKKMVEVAPEEIHDISAFFVTLLRREGLALIRQAIAQGRLPLTFDGRTVLDRIIASGLLNLQQLAHGMAHELLGEIVPECERQVQEDYAKWGNKGGDQPPPPPPPSSL